MLAPLAFLTGFVTLGFLMWRFGSFLGRHVVTGGFEAGFLVAAGSGMMILFILLLVVSSSVISLPPILLGLLLLSWGATATDQMA